VGRSSMMGNGVTSSAVSSATEPARIIVFSGVPLQPRVTRAELPCGPASVAATDPKTFQARVRLPAMRAQTGNSARPVARARAAALYVTDQLSAGSAFAPVP